VGRERLQVAAAGFVVDDVEDERGFARAGHAGDDGHPAVGNVDIDVLEVVLGGPADFEVKHGRESAIR